MGETAILSTFGATLFALLNPVGMLPVFMGYTEGLGPGVQRWLALFVAGVTNVIVQSIAPQVLKLH